MVYVKDQLRKVNIFQTKNKLITYTNISSKERMVNLFFITTKQSINPPKIYNETLEVYICFFYRNCLGKIASLSMQQVKVGPGLLWMLCGTKDGALVIPLPELEVSGHFLIYCKVLSRQKSTINLYEKGIKKT